MSYTKNFTPTYENGWQNKPSTETPITATAMDNYDSAIEYIENYLETTNPIGTSAADERYIKNQYLSLTQTLSTLGETSYTFTNELITSDSTIDVYTSINLNYTNIVITSGQCVVTYPKQDTEVSMTCKIYIK